MEQCMDQIAAGSGSRLGQLVAWLADGWRIEEPVLQRSALYDRQGRVCMLEVVVNRQGERRVIALNDVPETQEFLAQHRLVVLDVA